MPLKKLSPIFSYIPYAPYRGITWQLFDKQSISLLEVGCGTGKLMQVRHFNKCRLRVGVDVYPPYLLRCIREGLYDLCIVASATNLPFREKVFDAVLCVEVIEHIPKAVGSRIIMEFEKLARRQVLISTTNISKDMLDVATTDSGIENPHMVHTSWWLPEDFRRLGYKVRGVYPRGSNSSIFDPAYYLSNILPLIIICYFRPEVAKAIICCKDTSESSNMTLSNSPSSTTDSNHSYLQEGAN